MEQQGGGLVDLAVRIADGEVIRAPRVEGLGHDRFVREALGIDFDEFSRGRIVAHLEAGPQHWQHAGIVHGGVWCSVVETLASWGAALHAAPPGSEVVGVSNSTAFLRPHREGRVDAVATPVDLTGSQQLWDVVITRAADGKQLARGSVRLQQLDTASSQGGAIVDLEVR
jgi:1,4-dihydroxy-2-naphthoyl-CoA hydrolase